MFVGWCVELQFPWIPATYLSMAFDTYGDIARVDVSVSVSVSVGR